MTLLPRLLRARAGTQPAGDAHLLGELSVGHGGHWEQDHDGRNGSPLRLGSGSLANSANRKLACIDRGQGARHLISPDW
jgi:hypothetical protein